MAKEIRINRNIRMTDKEWQTFKDLLGAEWLRKQIDKAEKKANRPTVGTTDPEK